MITREQFVNGILSYADNEVMPALPTIGKWGVGTLIVLAKNEAENILNELIVNPVVKSLKVVSNDGLIDADKLFNALKTSAERYGNLQLNIPIIGTLKFSSADIDKMKYYVLGGVRRNDGNITQ